MLAPPPVTVLRGHTDAVNCISFFHPKLLLSGSVTGELRVFDLTTRRSVLTVTAHTESVLSVGSLENGKLFMTAGKDGCNRLWDMEQGAAISSYNTGAMHFCNSATDSAGLDIYTFVSPSSEEKCIILWDRRTPHPALTISDRTRSDTRGMVTSLHYKTAPAGGALLFAGFESGSISYIDIRIPDYRFAEEINTSLMQPVLALDVSSNDRYILAGGGGAGLSYISRGKHESSMESSALIDAASGEDKNDHSTTGIHCSKERKFNVHNISLREEGTSSVKFRRDSRIFISGHWDGSLQIRERKSLKLLARLKHHRGTVYCTDFVSDKLAPYEVSLGCGALSGVFASGSKDGTIAIWDLYANKMKD